MIDYGLYLVTDRRWLMGRDLVACIEEAILGGVTVVQLREKDVDSRSFFLLAGRMKALTDRYGIPLIVNDRLDIALAVGAAGVHLGLDDLPVATVRKILGPGKIVGASAATVEEAQRFEKEGADYLGVGAVFETATKLGNESVSFDDLRSIKRAVNIPVVAIGGIKAENAGAVMKMGVDGVAVVSSILAMPDVREAAIRLAAAVRGAGK
ncbi:MAG: thiamine phosphate synthase [Deltaproteobacteria bacterium HGW-Deltaproteobacteria-19]|jgi:thiamine-phosphate pyrophosphorylase|nr:MAG: thiamine phosphate synthase [Deltaproteobacteria bacterium HGW-Deltaproteobacteria-19]